MPLAGTTVVRSGRYTVASKGPADRPGSNDVLDKAHGTHDT